MRDSVNNANVKYMVTTLYRYLLPHSHVMRERLRNLLNSTRRQYDSKMPMNQLDVTKDVASQGVIPEVYRGTREGFANTEHMGGPMP